MTVIFGGVADDGFGFLIGDDLAIIPGAPSFHADKVALVAGRFAVASCGLALPQYIVKGLAEAHVRGEPRWPAPISVEALLAQIVECLEIALPQMQGNAEQHATVVVLDCTAGALYECRLGPLFPHPREWVRETEQMPTGRVFRFGVDGVGQPGRDHAGIEDARADTWAYAREWVEIYASRAPSMIGGLGAGVVVRDGVPEWRA